MKRTTIFRKTVRSLVAVAAASLAVSSVVALIALRGLYDSSTTRGDLRAARALSALAAETDLSDPVAAEAFCRAAAAGSDFRVTLIAPSGDVLADSEADPAAMDNHRSRPEVARALAGADGASSRRSATLGEELRYAAVPVRRDGAVVAILRLALSAPELNARLVPFYLGIAGTFVLTLVFAALWASRTATASSEPIASLVRASDAWADGREIGALPETDTEELASLAGAMRSMAKALADRAAENARRRDELDTILNGMDEAVVAVDGARRITALNRKATELFGSPAETAIGATPLEAFRSSEVDALLAGCLASRSARETEFSLFRDGALRFAANAAPLADGGAVLVLNDVTRMRRLEELRRDFVANVSHELKTPVTLVKGYAETLLDGAARDRDEELRFLRILARNADRLDAIIDDLLALASLERPDAPAPELRPVRLKPILDAAVEAVVAKRPGTGHSASVACPDGLEIRTNAGLLEQIVVNYLDNAFKYSADGSPVTLSARATEDGRVEIAVADRGSGVPARDLPRLFERFYRVDKGRSRDQGGTGLGLAVVKHIALALGGEVRAESREGEGSRFSVILPG